MSFQATRQLEKTLAIPKRKMNWRIWAGFLLAAASIPGYIGLFARFPITRDGPWTSWLMFTAAAWLLWAGTGRAFGNPEAYRGKTMGPILAVISVALAALFGYATLYASRQLPPSVRAPRVGTKAPEFTLADTNGRIVTLSKLLSEPMTAREQPFGTKPRWVLLVFYRGFW